MLATSPNRLERYPRDIWTKPGFTGGTRPRRCTQRIPGNPFPTLCEHRVHKAGRCTEHYNSWRDERDARRRHGTSLPRRSSGVRPSKPYMRKGGTSKYDRERMEKAQVKRELRAWKKGTTGMPFEVRGAA